MASAAEPAARSGPGWGWILLYGIVSVALGVLAFAWPFSATLAAAFVVACFLMTAGIISILAGIFAPGHEGRLYALLFGLLSLVVGGLMAFWPVAGAWSLTMLVAIWLFVRGMLELGLGLRYRRHRWLMVALGVVDVLLGIYVVVMLPWAALAIPGFILALSFVVGGAVAVMQALAHRQGAPAFAAPE